MNHRRSKPRRKKGCGLCKSHKRDGNSRNQDRAAEKRMRLTVRDALALVS